MIFKNEAVKYLETRQRADVLSRALFKKNCENDRFIPTFLVMSNTWIMVPILKFENSCASQTGENSHGYE